MSAWRKRKLVLLVFSFPCILFNHEWTRCTVYGFFGTLLFYLFISWMRHPLSDERHVAHVPKGYLTMRTIHDTFNLSIRNQLQTTAMGLGLVRTPPRCKASRRSPSNALLA